MRDQHILIIYVLWMHHSLSDSVKADRQVLFTQDRLWSLGIVTVDNAIVVAENISGSIHRDPTHSELITEKYP